jgi:hypothetical protein
LNPSAALLAANEKGRAPAVEKGMSGQDELFDAIDFGLEVMLVRGVLVLRD